jgi:hypothetical protein
MAATLTQAGLNLLAQLTADGETLAIDTVVYADIDLLDPADTPPLTEALPDEAVIRHTASLTQAAKVGDDTVVFSSYLGSTVGDFYFNWVGLLDSSRDVLVAVSYVARQQKIAGTGTTSGNSLTKNLALQYTSLASLANVTISPETWQLDHEATHTAMQADIDAHKARVDNPHAVTPGQIGAASVADFANSLAENGYQKLPGGLIMQWGRAETDGTVTFPIPFPSAVYNVQATTNYKQTSASSDAEVYVADITLTEFWYNYMFGPRPIFWFAVGK